VANGSLDLGILLMLKEPPNEAVAATVLHQWPRRLWLPGNHRLLTVEKIDLSDVLKLPFIALTLDDAWNYALKYWELMPCRPEPIYKTDSIEAVRNMIGAGMGVTILSDMLYRRWSLEGHRIELRDLETKIPPLDIGYIVNKNGDTPAAARVFMAYLQRASSSPTFRST
jgi:DNA-binding transcriptional LysR family regulator